MSGGAVAGIFFGAFFLLSALFYVAFYFMFWSPMARQAKRDQKQRDLEAKLKNKELIRESEIKIQSAKQQAVDASKPKFCPYCRAQNKNDASNCTNCGAAI